MSQLNIDETEVTIRFKNLNNDTEYTWSDDFQMHIDYVFHFPDDKIIPKSKGRNKLVFDPSMTTHKELTIVVGQVECGMLCTDDTVLINGRAFDISHIIHTGYKPQDIKHYAEPGMNDKLHDVLIGNKKRYTVTIEEHISGEFIVHADNLNEALRMAELNYRRGVFVVEPTVPTCRQMMALEESTNKETEWVKF